VAHAFQWEHSDKRLELAQLLGQLGVLLTWAWLALEHQNSWASRSRGVSLMSSRSTRHGTLLGHSRRDATFVMPCSRSAGMSLP
jgi:hypothetical protein